MAGLSLAAFALGLPAFVAVKVLAPGFFARQDTRAPVRAGVLAMLANMALTVAGVLAWLGLGWAGPHAALALATALAAYLNAGLLYRWLAAGGHYAAGPGTRRLLLRAAAATALMAAVLWPLIPPLAAWSGMGFGARLALLLGLIALGAAVYAAALWLLGARPRDLRLAAAEPAP